MGKRELTEQEREALAPITPPGEVSRTEYAVTYYERGKLVAEGPFDDAALAGRKAEQHRGVVSERQVTETFGEWQAE